MLLVDAGCAVKISSTKADSSTHKRKPVKGRDSNGLHLDLRERTSSTGGNVILYHGTSTSCASAIQQHGFQAPDLPGIVTSFAARYGHNPQNLAMKLDDLDFFTACRGEDSRIYFTTHFNHAASYASRSPEYRWDCLWGVYLLRHPELANDWSASQEGHLWVLREMMDDPPVVLSVDVPEDLLADEIWRINFVLDDEPSDSDNGLEVELQYSGHLPVIDQTPVNFRIHPPLLCYLVGVSPEEMAEQVRSGLWGQPTVYKIISEYWEWPDVKERLPVTRLRELGLTD